MKSVLLLRSIRIYENFQQFSRTWFSKKMRIIGKMKKKFFLHITMERCWNLKDFRDQVSDKSGPHNFHRDLNCYQNIMYTHLATITTKVLKQQRITLTRTKVNISCNLCIRATAKGEHALPITILWQPCCHCPNIATAIVATVTPPFAQNNRTAFQTYGFFDKSCSCLQFYFKFRMLTKNI